jgi:hypothetical protein
VLRVRAEDFEGEERLDPSLISVEGKADRSFLVYGGGERFVFRIMQRILREMGGVDLYLISACNFERRA